MPLATLDNDCPAFTYTPLPDTGTVGDTVAHIRLLEVHDRSSDTSGIGLSIYCTSMKDAPPYDAISYTWGDERDQEKIYVETAHEGPRDLFEPETSRFGFIAVRKNCADVLRQLLHFKTSRYYWIDAICIDQQNLEEKNVQVWRMGKMFGQAKTVLMCIGMHDEASQLIVSMFESFHTYVSKPDVSILIHQQDYIRSQVDKESASHSIEKVCAYGELSCAWMRSFDGGQFESFYHAMRTLARRPYFWRIWTLQEIWVAHQLKVFCGNDELHLPSLLWWWWQGPEVVDGLRTDLGYAYENILYERQVRPWNNSTPVFRRFSPYELLELCRGRKCQDPRDIVFGTLSMTDWSMKEDKLSRSWAPHQEELGPVLPDYKESAFELAKKLISRFCLTDLNLSHMERMCRALRLGPDTPEIDQGMAARSKPGLCESALVPVEDFQRMSYIRSAIRISKPGFRIGSDVRCESKSNLRKSQGYTQLVKQNKDSRECVAIACGSVQDGDWLVILHRGRALILREHGSYLFVLGKALVARGVFFKETQYVKLQLSIEDLVIFLCGSSWNWLDVRSILDGECAASINDGDLVHSKEYVLAWLNGQICGKTNSSFALVPTKAGSEVDYLLGQQRYAHP